MLVRQYIHSTLEQSLCEPKSKTQTTLSLRTTSSVTLARQVVEIGLASPYDEVEVCKSNFKFVFFLKQANKPPNPQPSSYDFNIPP